MNELQKQPEWYDKTWLVVLLCVVFFPVGIYALWKNESIAKGWKIGITLIIGLALLSTLDKTDPNAKPSVPEAEEVEKAPEYWHADNAGAAYEISKYYVKANLKSPSTADFPYTDYKSWRLDTANYVIKGYVDSQNGFGATIRSYWRTEMVFNGGEPFSGGSWTVKAFSFEE